MLGQATFPDAPTRQSVLAREQSARGATPPAGTRLARHWVREVQTEAGGTPGNIQMEDRSRPAARTSPLHSSRGFGRATSLAKRPVPERSRWRAKPRPLPTRFSRVDELEEEVGATAVHRRLSHFMDDEQRPPEAGRNVLHLRDVLKYE